VPDVTGWNLLQATRELEGAKLILAPVQYEESNYPDGTVLFQSLNPDSSVLEHSEIILTVSQQIKPQVTIPYSFGIRSDLIGEIHVTVSVDGAIQYSGTHTSYDGTVTVPLTAEVGYHPVVVTQNGMVTENFYTQFGE
jgi:hypothetical protein